VIVYCTGYGHCYPWLEHLGLVQTSEWCFGLSVTCSMGKCCRVLTLLCTALDMGTPMPDWIT
jgi:hypothetical protein